MKVYTHENGGEAEFEPADAEECRRVGQAIIGQIAIARPHLTIDQCGEVACSFAEHGDGGLVELADELYPPTAD
jgi:hypothetical protein